MGYKVGDKVIYQNQPATIIDIQGDFLRISYIFGTKKVQKSQVKPENNTPTTNNPPPPPPTPVVFKEGDIVLYKNQPVTILDIDGPFVKITANFGVKKVPKTDLKPIPTTETSATTPTVNLNINNSIKGTTSSNSNIKLNLNNNPKFANPTASIQFNTKNLIKNKLKNLVSLKPMLISVAELEEIKSQPPEGFNTLNFPTGFVGYDETIDVLENSDKPVTPRLINWVEPYIISGATKTLFYTEVNSNLKVGDRVFIINGNYDSDLLIQKDKYKKGRDGYKILFIDKCQVVLDIDYTGVLPYLEGELDDFIKIYYVKDENEFKWINRQFTTRGGTFEYKYNFYQNNIIYTDQDFLNPISGWGSNPGLTSSPGFFVRDDYNTLSNGTYSWTNISSDFISSGSYSYALSPTYSNVDRVIILGGSFKYSSYEFKEGFVYKWEVGPTQSMWVVDVKYSKPILAKGNFRDGNFDGVWNSGLYGRQNKKIKWTGNKSTWNTGTLLNTIWEKGTINSKYTLQESYFTEIDEYGFPYQKINAPNNNGRGFNFLIDSEIKTSQIENASIINTVIGSGSSTYSVIENYLLSQEVPFNNIIKKAYFEDTEIQDVLINNSEVRNLRALNSKFDNVKSINSYFDKSLIKNSDFISEEIIKVLGYDEFNMSENKTISSTFSNNISHKVYKFYIDKKSYNRLKDGDFFYLKGININDGQKNLQNFFDKKFKIGTWTEYEDSFYDVSVQTNLVPYIPNYSFYKRGIDVTVLLSTPEDNKFRYNSITASNVEYYTTVVDENAKKNYSVDIVFSINDVVGNSTNYNFNQTPIALDSPTMSTISNIIDVTNAYIVDCDFEGLFERSNWNSGFNFNYNNDVNITEISNQGGLYNLQIITASSTIIATTSLSSLYWTTRETEEGYLDTGEIVFLNSVYYDTTGKVDGLIIVGSGSGYSATESSSITINGNGTGLTVDLTSTVVGSVYDLDPTIGPSTPAGGQSYTNGSYTNVSTTPLGVGSGLTLDVVVSAGTVSAVTINNPGAGYIVGGIVRVTGITCSIPAEVTITGVYNGEVISATPSSGGVHYSIGDIVTINTGGVNAQLQITSLTGSMTRLPDAYKVVNNVSGEVHLKEITTSTYSIFTSLLEGGIFLTDGGKNRWGYLNKTKITKSKIKGGYFKRTYLNENLIQNLELDLTDKDFTNLSQFKKLLLSDILFTDNNNIVSKGTYMNSNFRLGSDIWDDGVFYNSVWNSGTFSKGLVKESNWNDGEFKSGIFYSSRSFNANPGTYSPNYDVDKVNSYFKSGYTSATESNNRFSWRMGTFKGGEFVKSDWEKGEFDEGKFYNSKWYAGNFNGGIFGDSTLSTDDTKFYNGNFKNGVVQNARFYAEDSSLSGASQSTIIWEKGTFNQGIFASKIDTTGHSATWQDGTFNGGEFTTNAVWLNGTFNGGKFNSGFGWTCSPQIDSISTSQSQYSWQDGVFNGGEFGIASGETNSTWWTGEFNGGQFRGRVWKDGVFTDGRFYGSGTFSPVGGYSIDGMTESNASRFVDTFTNSFYGVWNDGFVTPDKDDFIKTKKLFTPLLSKFDIVKPQILVNFENVLWNGGTFSHPGGKISKSVWLSGQFVKGKFVESSFNPWVKRELSTSYSFDINDDLQTGSGSCVWINGTLENSDFYISQWRTGKFISGTAIGAIWRNGTTNYMNAYNVTWENGLWRNGNWNGSYLTFDDTVDSEFSRQLLYRGMQYSGTSSCHIWNIFLGTGLTSSLMGSAAASSNPGSISVDIAEILPDDR